MKNFADKMILSSQEKLNSCIVGLDPRIDLMPEFIIQSNINNTRGEGIVNSITDFHKIVIDCVYNFVPGVKLQVAFYEQYGVAGMIAFENTLNYAKEKGLVTIVDAKRNDIGSTAEAYANSFLGRSNVFGIKYPIYDVDCITVSPFLGEDSLIPFINDCIEYGKGIFVLVKTSNPGSGDLQDLIIKDKNEEVYLHLAKMVKKLGISTIGNSGYSSIGAVVGATFPHEAEKLRCIMDNNIFLVPGYGAQGASGKDVVNCFNNDRLGAVVNASRSITYNFGSKDISKAEFANNIENNTKKMIEDVNVSLDNLIRKN